MPNGSDRSGLRSIEECDGALYRLLILTLRSERLVAERDAEIAAVQKRYATRIASAGIETASLEAEIGTYYQENRQDLERGGKKSIQLGNGTLGMRAPAQPPLVPLNQKWTWEKIAAKVKDLWKKKYFHAPKEPGLDKVKLKKELDAEQLRECGLKLDTDERFYYELNRLAIPDAAVLQDDVGCAAKAA
jgi:hypothetical protein